MGKTHFNFSERHVRSANLVERAVAVSRVIAVISEPVARLRRAPGDLGAGPGRGYRHEDGVRIDAAQVSDERSQFIGGQIGEGGHAGGGIAVLQIAASTVRRTVPPRADSWRGRDLARCRARLRHGSRHNGWRTAAVRAVVGLRGEVREQRRSRCDPAAIETAPRVRVPVDARRERYHYNVLESNAQTDHTLRQAELSECLRYRSQGISPEDGIDRP